MKLINTKLIIDFDSTLIKIETMDEFASQYFPRNEFYSDTLTNFRSITDKVLNGLMSYDAGIDTKFRLLTMSRDEVNKFSNYVSESISESILNHLNFLRENTEDIYVVSGGFFDWMGATITKLGIKFENVYANSMVYDELDTISGYDKTNPLCHSDGKHKVINGLKLNGTKVMVGDGYTDFETKETGSVDLFIAYTENIRRENVVTKSEYEAKSFDEVLNILKENGLIQN